LVRHPCARAAEAGAVQRFGGDDDGGDGGSGGGAPTTAAPQALISRDRQEQAPGGVRCPQGSARQTAASLDRPPCEPPHSSTPSFLEEGLQHSYCTNRGAPAINEPLRHAEDAKHFRSKKQNNSFLFKGTLKSELAGPAAANRRRAGSCSSPMTSLGLVNPKKRRDIDGVGGGSMVSHPAYASWRPCVTQALPAW